MSTDNCYVCGEPRALHINSVCPPHKVQPIVPPRMAGQSDVERSGNPKRSADRPAKISVFMVEAENVTQETMSSILRTLADHIDRTS